MFDYMTVKETTMKYASVWAIPKDVEKPKDERIVTGKYIKEKKDSANIDGTKGSKGKTVNGFVDFLLLDENGEPID